MHVFLSSSCSLFLARAYLYSCTYRETYHPSFALYACRPTSNWRPETDDICTSSAFGGCAGRV